jgi:hypothetical protein
VTIGLALARAERPPDGKVTQFNIEQHIDCLKTRIGTQKVIVLFRSTLLQKPMALENYRGLQQCDRG